MITIHHLGHSQSHRIAWLCEELGVPYRLQHYARDAVTRLAPAEYRALHPAGTAPVITDEGRVLAESGAIMEYILQTHGGGRLVVAPGDLNHADYLFWFHFANGSLMPDLMFRMILRRSCGSDDDAIVRAMAARAPRAFALVEKRLGEVPFLAGRAFTAADIISFFPLAEMRAWAGMDLPELPNLGAYLARIRARPGMVWSASAYGTTTSSTNHFGLAAGSTNLRSAESSVPSTFFQTKMMRMSLNRSRNALRPRSSSTPSHFTA